MTQWRALQWAHWGEARPLQQHSATLLPLPERGRAILQTPPLHISQQGCIEDVQEVPSSPVVGSENSEQVICQLDIKSRE